MKDDYRLIAKRSTGIVILSHPQYGEQMWTTVKVRKHKRCVITDEDLKGKEGWSPITNGYNRMDRISHAGMFIIERYHTYTEK